MSFRLSFLSRPKKLETVEDSIEAFSASLSRNNFSFHGSEASDLNNSRRAQLQINKFMSMRSLNDGSANETEKPSLSTMDDIDISNKSTLLEELKPTAGVPLEDTHGHTINARKIYMREARKSRISRFEAPHFPQDLRRLLSTEKYQSRRSDFASVGRVSDVSSLAALERSVSFIDVTIREYPIIAGQNPAGSGGPPLTIAWEHLSSVDLDIDKYEDVRAGNRRKQEEMKMDQFYRKKLLKALGFSLVEIQESTKQATIVRNRRRQCNADLDKDDFHENLEFAKRRFVHVVTFGYKKRKKEKYLKKNYENYDREQDLKKMMKKEKSMRRRSQEPKEDQESRDDDPPRRQRRSLEGLRKSFGGSASRSARRVKSSIEVSARESFRKLKRSISVKRARSSV